MRNFRDTNGAIEVSSKIRAEGISVLAAAGGVWALRAGCARLARWLRAIVDLSAFCHPHFSQWTCQTPATYRGDHAQAITFTGRS
jgi:hypothetical protein